LIIEDAVYARFSLENQENHGSPVYVTYLVQISQTRKFWGQMQNMGFTFFLGFHSSDGPLIQPLIPIPFFFSFGMVVAVLE
jgi:hypothetical protein